MTSASSLLNNVFFMRGSNGSGRPCTELNGLSMNILFSLMALR